MSGKTTGETCDSQNPQCHHVRALAPLEKCLLASDLASLCSCASGRAALEGMAVLSQLDVHVD